MSARSVLSVLDHQKYDVIQIGITRAGKWVTGENVLDALSNRQEHLLTPAVLLPEPGKNTLYTLTESDNGLILKPLAALDVIFPLLHGSYGEDGAPQGLFELANIAYVGAGVLGSAVGMDKGLFKDLMRAWGVPVADAIVISRAQIQTQMDQILSQAEALAPYPLFTKPANLGSSVGVSKCHSRSDLLEGLMEAARYDRRVLVERGIRNAREIEISVLGNSDPIVSLPGEIIPSDEFYSYDAKYIDERSQLIIPAPLTPELTRKVQEIALTVYRAVDCAGMARVDFLFDGESNELVVSEINTIPGFTRISMYPKLWDACGLSYPALIDRLVELALERQEDREHTERTYRRGE